MVKRIVLLCLGFGALGLAALGIALPVLPTTPFVLCAAGCFGASSPALARRLENTRYFGEYIRNYKSKTGISRSARVTGLVFLWGALGLSAFFMAQKPAVVAVLLLVGVAVSVHLLTIRRAAGQNAAPAPPAEAPPPQNAP